jgi:hypothetical protein
MANVLPRAKSAGCCTSRALRASKLAVRQPRGEEAADQYDHDERRRAQRNARPEGGAPIERSAMDDRVM